jgi:undecaprenyl diphosphate synthase
MTPTDNTKAGKLPEHVVIIMDGNGRWAEKRGRPRIAGHRAGVNSLREIVRYSAGRGIRALTVYAFSSENWNRPGSEISRLLELFMTSLRQEVSDLNKNNIKLRFIGDLAAFPENLQMSIREAEMVTGHNTGMQFVVAANYGGRWDITHAFRLLAGKILSGEISAAGIDEKLIQSCLLLSDLPDPDLFIRTGGESRISNYLLWQLAYTELYFTECLWPEFGPPDFEKALIWYAGRERRFGRTGEQIRRSKRA